MATSTDLLFNIVGFAGSSFLACALLPQIYRAHKTRSTADISFIWQAVYTTGLCMMLAYYVHNRLWAVCYPIVVETGCIIYLTSYKVYIDIIVPRRTARKGDPAKCEGTPRALHGSSNADRESKVKGYDVT